MKTGSLILGRFQRVESSIVWAEKEGKSRGQKLSMSSPCGYDLPRMGWSNNEYQIEDQLISKLLWRITQCFARNLRFGIQRGAWVGCVGKGAVSINDCLAA